MTALRLEDFQGMMPKRDKRSLPGMMGQITANCKLWSGAIDPLKKPLAQFTPTKSGTMLSMFRMDNRTGGADFWLHWPFDVDAERGVVVDTRQRLYYTGEYEPRVTTFEMASLQTDTVDGTDNYPGGFGTSGTDYPLAFYALGVPNPPTKGRVTSITGGGAADITRAYVYTLVDEWGQESGPSPAFIETGAADGTWNLELLDTGFVNTATIVHAVHASGVVTIYCDEVTFLKKNHRLTIASVVGMTDLNASWTVLEATNRSYRTVSRERTSNVATLELEDIEGIAVNDVIQISSVGGSGYDGTQTVTAVDFEAKTIDYADVAGDEGNTADTGGQVQLGQFSLTLTTAQSYTSGGDFTREAPWNTAGLVKRIYRSLTGNAETNYQFVADLLVATTTYADAKVDTDLGFALVTVGFDVPNGELFGLSSMANGMMVAGFENEVHFAEAYHPYAWVIEYIQPINYPVVGLASFGNGQSIAVGTTGYPYVMTGVSPGTVTADDIESIYPCVAKRGIQSIGWAVLYPTDNGLVMVQNGTAELVSQLYYSRDEWQDLANGGDFASSMIFDNRYYAFWTNAQGTSEGLIFDPKNPSTVVTQNTEPTNAAWRDLETGIAYVVNFAGIIGKWDSDDAFKLTYQWKSKEIKLKKPVNMGACRVEGEFTATAAESAALDAENVARAARNATLIASIPGGAKRGVLRGASGSGAAIQGFRDSALIDRETVELGGTILEEALSDGQFIQVEVIAGGVSKFVKTVSQEGSFRLPGGYRSDEYEFNITGNVRTQSVTVAETMKELEQV